MELPPLALISSLISCDFFSSRSLTTTLAPCFANNLAVSAPIPRPDPVIIATYLLIA